MTKAMGSRARILLTQTLKRDGLDHIMGAWFGAMVLATVFVALSPAQDATAAVAPREAVLSGLPVTAAERHCMVQTALGEATPGHKAEVIAIMRGMLKRRQTGRWGDLCGVVKARKQYSVWNDRKMPGRPKKPGRLYRKYSAWADLAVMAGPSRFTHYYHGKAMRQLYGRSRPYWAKACVERVKVGGATMCRMG